MRETMFVLAISFGAIGPSWAQDIKVNDVVIRFECDQTYSEYDRPSTPSQTATATATVPTGGGWVMTGGGCERPENYSAVDMYSKPSDSKDGWTCQTADFPGLRVNSAVRAVVRYCRIVAR